MLKDKKKAFGDAFNAVKEIANQLTEGPELAQKNLEEKKEQQKLTTSPKGLGNLILYLDSSDDKRKKV